MVNNYVEKVKSLFEERRQDLYIAALIFLVGLGSFGLGRLSALWPKKEPLRISDTKPNISNTKDQQKKNSALKGKYVASISGSAYHLPWCPGAQKIKEENKIWFDTKEEAENRGYKPAGNCEGL